MMLDVNGSETLHQSMHDALAKEGVPFKTKFVGTQDEMLDAVRRGYQGMDQKGFLKIPDGLPNANGAISRDITIAEAVVKQLEWNKNQLNRGNCP